MNINETLVIFQESYTSSNYWIITGACVSLIFLRQDCEMPLLPSTSYVTLQSFVNSFFHCPVVRFAQSGAALVRSSFKIIRLHCLLPYEHESHFIHTLILFTWVRKINAQTKVRTRDSRFSSPRSCQIKWIEDLSVRTGWTTFFCATLYLFESLSRVLELSLGMNGLAIHWLNIIFYKNTTKSKNCPSLHNLNAI